MSDGDLTGELDEQYPVVIHAPFACRCGGMLTPGCPGYSGAEEPADLAHYTRRMLQALDGYWLHYDGYQGRGAPLSLSTAEDWWCRFERYRARVEALLDDGGSTT